jgi:hypothetical protein
VRCEVAERFLSAAMDDPAEPVPVDAAAHAAGCPRCSAFGERAWRLRHSIRFEVAEPVPDLVPAIMARVAAEAGRAQSDARFALGRTAEAPAAPAADVPATLMPGGVPVSSGSRRGTAWRRAVGLAAAIGLVAGYLVTAGVRGPQVRGGRALAEEIPHRLVVAAVSLGGYRATFDVTERHWARAVPVRTFVASIAFRSPEDLRVEVRDTTSYPPGNWIPNDLHLVSDGRTWLARGPQSCPQGTPPSCPGRAEITRLVEHRIPFDGQTSLPTDVIVPMTVLAAQDRVEVVGRGRVGGRDAIGVALAEHDALPLWGFLEFLGSWRPFFPQDRVVVWLDARTWFPLKYQVVPAAGAARRLWTRQVGLPPEPPDRPVFTAVARKFATTPPPEAAFAIPAAGGDVLPVDEGFRHSAGVAGRVPAPGWLDGLRKVEAGVVEGPGQPAGPSERADSGPGVGSGEAAASAGVRIVAFARGLAWLTVEEVRGWRSASPFGVGPFAEPVRLRRGPAAYEPASGTEPRRVALHTAGAEYLLSTNLPRPALLRIAASLPVRPLSPPAAWSVRRSPEATVRTGLDPSAALAAAGFDALRPGWLPAGYRAAGAQTLTAPGVRGVTVVYRRPAAELDGVGLALYQAAGETLPPPTESDVFEVRVEGTAARWAPQDHRLEWVQSGVYRSLTGPAFDLGSLVRVADSLQPVEGP